MEELEKKLGLDELSYLRSEKLLLELEEFNSILEKYYRCKDYEFTNKVPYLISNVNRLRNELLQFTKEPWFEGFYINE